MKTISELDKSTLTTEQKLGLLLCANLNHGDAENVAVIVPKIALALAVLAKHIEAEAAHLGELGKHRAVGGRRV